MPDPTSRGEPAVRLERYLPAAPGTVFAAWTEPALVSRWMSPLGHAEVALDVRVGGTLEVVMVDAMTRIEHRGTFLEVDPPRRIRFTWVSQHTGMTESVVTVDLVPEGSGTRLVLLHERLPADAVASHVGGWGAMVERLAGVLSQRTADEVRS